MAGRVSIDGEAVTKHRAVLVGDRLRIALAPRTPSGLTPQDVPLTVRYVGHDREELLAEAESVRVHSGGAKEGDLIVLTIGEPIGKSGGTNTMKIVRVGENAAPPPHESI